MLELDKNPDYKRRHDFTQPNEYYDWDIQFQGRDLWGKYALDQMIENVLLTEPQERLFNLSYGTPLYELLFQNISDVYTIMPQIFDIIEYWVPIKIDRSAANITTDPDNNSISFQISYVSNNGLCGGVFARRLIK